MSEETGPESGCQSTSREDQKRLTRKNPATTTYTLDDVDKNTFVDPHSVPLNAVFVDIEPAKLQLKDMFPDKDQANLIYVRTKLREEFYPNTNKINPERAVVFESYVGNGFMIVDSAYRAPETGSTAFHASEVFKKHFKKADVDERPKFVIQRKIQSRDGVAFLKRITEEQGLKPGDHLDAGQLKEYTTTVSNGKLTGHILKDMRLKSESAFLLAEYKVQDDDTYEYEDDSFEEGNEDDVSHASFEKELPYHYSIVSKTSLLDEPHASSGTTPTIQADKSE